MTDLVRRIKVWGRVLAALSLALLMSSAAGKASAPATVKFHLSADCMCASCNFSSQAMLRKLPGIERVSLSAREKMFTIAFDEAKTPLSTLAAALEETPLGKNSALIGELPRGSQVPDPKALSAVPGVRSASLDIKKSEIFVALKPGTPQTITTLSAALAAAGAPVRFTPTKAG